MLFVEDVCGRNLSPLWQNISVKRYSGGLKSETTSQNDNKCAEEHVEKLMTVDV